MGILQGEDDTMCIAFRLRKLRMMAGFRSAKEFAQSVGISYNAYLNYENPTYSRLPNTELLIKIADKLNISIDYLLCRTNKLEELQMSDKMNCCPYCGSEEYYIKQYATGTVILKSRDFLTYGILKS